MNETIKILDEYFSSAEDVLQTLNSTEVRLSKLKLSAEHISYISRMAIKERVSYDEMCSRIANDIEKLTIKIQSLKDYLKRGKQSEKKDNIKPSYSYDDKKNDYCKNNYEFEITNLKQIIDDLRQKGKKAVRSRDNWKKRAEIAESKLEEDHGSSNNNKFKKVKINFSKMYHPDNIPGNGFEKLIKQEIFKEFWQVIEKIETE